MLNVFYVQCLKRILCVKRTTPSYMVYGETGCTPLHVDIMKRALCFYVKLQHPVNATLASVMLSALHKKHHRGVIDSKYLIYIRQSLTSIGLPLLYNYNPHTTTITNTTFSSLKRAVSICTFMIGTQQSTHHTRPYFTSQSKTTTHSNPTSTCYPNRNAYPSPDLDLAITNSP